MPAVYFGMSNLIFVAKDVRASQNLGFPPIWRSAHVGCRWKLNSLARFHEEVSGFFFAKVSGQGAVRS